MDSQSNTESTVSPWLLLTIFHLCLSIALYLAIEMTRAAFLETVIASVSLAQVSLLVVWLVFKNGRLVHRFTLFFLLGILVARAGNPVTGSLSELVHLFVTGFIIGVPLFFAWSAGWQLVNIHDLGDYPIDSSVAPWQLSIRTLLVCTMLPGILLVVQRTVVAHSNSFLHGLVFLGYEFILEGALVLSAVRSCLSPRGFWARLLVPLYIAFLHLCIPMHAAIGSTAHSYAALTGAIEFFTIVLSLLFLRQTGVRVVRGYNRLAEFWAEAKTV